jgi:hypothetical protein
MVGIVPIAARHAIPSCCDPRVCRNSNPPSVPRNGARQSVNGRTTATLMRSSKYEDPLPRVTGNHTVAWNGCAETCA